MKKSFLIILALILSVSLFPMTTLAANIGDVIGYAQPTDIIATINGYKIESYNVNDLTYICVEDLRYYGFDVYYDNATRSLSFGRSSSTSISPNTTNPKYSSIGSNSQRRPILYTDIVTYANGIYTPASNINGQTIINFNSLSQFGAVSYDNNKREISLVINGLNFNPTPNAKPSASSTVATDASNFGKIKNYIINNYDEIDNGTYFLYKDIDEDCYYLSTYTPAENEITFFLYSGGEETVATTLVALPQGQKPNLFFSFEFSGGEELSFLAEFPNSYTPYVTISSEFPASLQGSLDELVNLELNILDLATQEVFGISFASLGIYVAPVY